MNKRIKLKKGILHKKCDDRCWKHRSIKKHRFITCNSCIGCKHRDIAEKMCEENEKFLNSLTYKDKLQLQEEDSIKDIEILTNKSFVERVKKEFHSKHHRYKFHEYLRILSAIRRILITQTTNEDIVINHMIKQVNKMHYSDFKSSN